MEEWIKHTGDVQPVDDYTLVLIKVRGGTTDYERLPVYAKKLDWRRTYAEWGITSYKIVEQFLPASGMDTIAAILELKP